MSDQCTACGGPRSTHSSDWSRNGNRVLVCHDGHRMWEEDFGQPAPVPRGGGCLEGCLVALLLAFPPAWPFAALALAAAIFKGPDGQRA